MKLDPKDVAILDVLVKDGRASLREVAARTSLTAPTVAARLARMEKGGLIMGYAPIIDPSAAQGVVAFVRLRIPPEKAGAASEALTKMKEVDGVYMTAGEGNVMVRVQVDGLRDLESLVARLSSRPRWRVVSSDAVTRAVKDSRRPRVPRSASIALKCDYCHQEVHSDRPYTIRVGPTSHFFCCRTCRRSYEDEHSAELAAARVRIRRTALHS